MFRETSDVLFVFVFGIKCNTYGITKYWKLMKYVHVWVHVHVGMCMCIYECACMHVCECMHVRVQACMSA